MCTILNYPFWMAVWIAWKELKVKRQSHVSFLWIVLGSFTSGSWQVTRRFDRNSGRWTLGMFRRMISSHRCWSRADNRCWSLKTVDFLRSTRLPTPTGSSRFLQTVTANGLTSRGANVLWSFTMPLWNRSSLRRLLIKRLSQWFKKSMNQCRN